ncbi:Cytochrome P450 [Corchorus olitorius]|uniref:Cytochrome P450 n=1 Tax=Corchorus olitorius TaxID=93759 RepID=A0A1R3HPB6_9ROSI|nr:Cytochrome P450 [Corchorus olitorius]
MKSIISMAENLTLTVLLTGSLCMYLVIALISKFLHKYWLTPLRIQHAMNLQGIKGPSYKFIHGNNKEILKMIMETQSKPMATFSHDMFPRVHPHIYSRINSYGKCYLSWRGSTPELYIIELEIVKELLKTTRGWPCYILRGEMGKSMTPAVIASVETMMKRWKQFEGKETEVFQEFRLLTSEVLSRTAFGSSYLEGKFWKSSDSIESDKLVKEIHYCVMEMVKKREEKVFRGEANSFVTDFLGLVVNSFHDPDKRSRLFAQDLVDEYKTFYLAGQEAVKFALAWTVLLLAMYPDWQEKARMEGIEVFGNQNPHSKGIGRLNVGIKGPCYKFIHGNNKETLMMNMEAQSKPMATLSHDILPRVHPHIYSWLNLYGKCYLSWRGSIPELYITEPELVKEILKSNDGSRAFPKRTSRERKNNEEDFVLKLIGDGLITADGQKWAKQRKVANYAFHGESLKNMTPAMIASVETMLDKWKQFEGKEMEVFQEFSFLKTKLPPVISKFWKTADSIESDKLAKEIHDSVMKMVKKREEKILSGETNNFGIDFLGLLLNSFHDPDKNSRLSVQDLVDECKTFYLAGQETVNSALAWTVLLLAIHPEWQEKARKEVIEVFGNKNPHSEGIGKLKIVSNILILMLDLVYIEF